MSSIGYGTSTAYVPRPIEVCVWCDQEMPGESLIQHHLEAHPFECQQFWVTTRGKVRSISLRIKNWRRMKSALYKFGAKRRFEIHRRLEAS